MEVKLYAKMLQKGWWIIVLTALVAVTIALVSAYFANPIYQATASFSVSPSTTLTGTDQITLNSLDTLDNRSIIQTYSEFLKSNRIYLETLADLGLDPVDVIEYERSTVVLPETNILSLTVTGDDPETVALIANTLGRNAITELKGLYNVYDVNVLDPATIQVIPIRPQPVRDAAVALALGVIVGAALAIFREEIRIPIEAYQQRLRIDPELNVFNRSYIEKRLTNFVGDGEGDGASIGLVRFNILSDMIGVVPTGVVQQLLRQITSMFKDELRGNDQVGRWDDETFIFFLPETNEDAARRTMKRIQLELEPPILIKNYDEEIQLDPVISTASIREGESGLEATRRAEGKLI